MSKGKRLMVKKRSEVPVENIIASYMDEREIELTEHEEQLKLRAETIYKKLIERDGILDVIQVHMKFFDVSQTTTYRDIQRAQLIFGTVNKFNKDFWRFIQIERKRNMIKRARIAGNLEVESKLERDIDALLNFDKDEAAFNPEKLANMNITIGMPDSIIKAFKDQISKGVIDLNELEAEDIDHTEVSEHE